MVPAAIVILVAGIIFFMIWLHDRGEIKALKKAHGDLANRVRVLEEQIADQTIGKKPR